MLQGCYVCRWVRWCRGSPVVFLANQTGEIKLAFERLCSLNSFEETTIYYKCIKLFLLFLEYRSSNRDIPNHWSDRRPKNLCCQSQCSIVPDDAAMWDMWFSKMHIFFSICFFYYVRQPKISEYPAYELGGLPGDPGFFLLAEALIYHRVNTMAVDGVVTQGSEASASIAFT